MRQRPRTLNLLVAWGVSALILSACSPAAVSPSPSSPAASTAVSTPAVTAGPPEAVRLGLPCPSGTVTDWAADPILQAIEAATNTDIAVTAVEYDAFVDTINAGAAAGEVPDLIGVVDPGKRTILEQWARDGLITPITGDVAAAAPNVLAQYELNPSLNEILVDGQVFFQPVSWGTSTYPNRGIIHVRKDLLDKYGLKVPETFDELMAFLETSKANGTGTSVFIGNDGPALIGALSAFAGAYGGPNDGWVRKNGGFENWAVQPSTRDGLLLFRELFARGLVDPGVLEMDDDKARTAYVSGKAPVLIYNGGGHIGRIQNDMALVDKTFQEWVLPAPSASDPGTKGYTTEPMFYGFASLGGLDSNNPVAAARVMNYLVSEEGYKLTSIGIEGRDYSVDSGEIVLNEEQRAKDGFPTEAGDTGAHPLAACIVSWQPQSWQDFSLLYGKSAEYKDWYNAMYANQGANQTATFGLTTTTPQWTEFRPIGNELIERTLVDVIKADSPAEATAIFDAFVNEWN